MDLYAVEEDRTYGGENRVCVKGNEHAQFSSALPGIRDQRQDGIQVEGALYPGGFGRDGGRIAPAQEQSRAVARGGGVRDRALKAGAFELGAAQNPGVVLAAAWRGGEREHVQASAGESRADGETATSSGGRNRALE